MKTCILLVLTLAQWAHGQDGCILAKTDSGMVCGVQKKAVNGDDIVSFLGIPYAKAPIGELRFAEPQRPDPFDGVFNATTNGPMCPHAVTEFGMPIPPSMYSEDCLRINVHVPLSAMPDPEGSCKPLLPVYFFIHGGSFATGSGSPDVYGPEYLLTKNIILVTINYRINSIGFLSLRSKYIPGNAGLRDALFALKWVHRNIRNFGGDPDEVTLGGQSAGGAIAHIIAVSPASRGLGLFKRVMSLSGTAIANFYTPSPLHAKIISELFLVGMGISSFQSPKAIYQKLIEAPIEKILEGNNYVQNRTGLVINFIPVVETPQEDFTTIINKDPGDLLKEGNGKEYKTFLGFASNECQGFRQAFINANIIGKSRALPILLIPQRILYRAYFLSLPILLRKIWSEYFNDTAPTIDRFLDLCTDSFYKYPALSTIEKRLAVGAEPTYVYQFGYHGENSLLRRLSGMDWEGASHSEDLTYFFRLNMFLGPITTNELSQSDPDSKMKELMTTLVANYVKTGIPVSPPLTQLTGHTLDIILSYWTSKTQRNYSTNLPPLTCKIRRGSSTYSIILVACRY